MRRWLWLIALLWCSQVWATVTLGHTNSASVSITGTGTAVTVTSIPSGHFVMGTVVWQTAGRTLSSCTATSSTCVVDTGCHGTLSGVGAIDCFYILSAGAILTSITLTASATTTGNWYINDYSTTAGSMAKDTECTGTPASSSTPAGGNLTLSGTNDVILQAISCSQTCSGTPSGWTNGVNTSGATAGRQTEYEFWNWTDLGAISSGNLTRGWIRSERNWRRREQRALHRYLSFAHETLPTAFAAIVVRSQLCAERLRTNAHFRFANVPSDWSRETESCLDSDLAAW